MVFINNKNYEQFLDLTNKTAIIILGAVEAHGLFSGLDTDIKIPEYICLKIEEKIGDKIAIFPTLNYGFCYTLREYPGTISLKSNTLYLILKDIIFELKRNGFKRVLFLNGHGANQGIAKTMLKENIENLGEDFRANVVSWWTLPRIKKEISQYGFIGHADFLESSCYLAINKKLPKENPKDDSFSKFPVGNVYPTPKSIFSKSGHMGKIEGINKEIGEKIIDLVVLDLIDIIENDLIFYEKE